ncbi:DUF3102 domain-containing protein [Bacillaceae bacterium IKA-2]|nr:DUF3102 domain-containing protein [Bacillaceae bacterium IKA-2]
MNQVSTRTTEIIAAEINSIKEQTRKMFLYNSIEIGRRLTEAKIMVPHGEWGKWLEGNVDYSQSTATNLLRIFEQFSSDQLSIFGANVKSQAFEKLSYSQAVALLGVPEEQREAFVKEKDVENMSTRELNKVIKEKKELELKLLESEQKNDKERDTREKISTKYDDLEKQSKTHAELSNRLQKELDKKESGGVDKEKLKKLQDSFLYSQTELEKYKSQITTLEEELKKKPIDVPATVEVIPEEVQKELNELREKAKKKDNKSEVKFSFCFEILVTNFQSLLASLDEIKEADELVHEKYKGAVTGLINKMSERL